ncbi:putative transposase, Ptta/En/Spm, plant [Helianthus annuus]|nr:putative transposase, Ptta/En/Spm, plant [Helianthus annuus]
MAGGTKGFVGRTATQFANECGIVIRSVCPMNFHKWESVPANIKNMMYEKLQGKFNLLRTDRVFMGYVDFQLHQQWKRTRGELSAHWKNNGGKTNPRLARSMMKSNCRSPEDWNHLCDYWELESTRRYSDQMECNRGKQVVTSRGGSRLTANHVYHMTNRETQTQPSPFEVYYKLHYNDKKGWQNDEAETEYANIIQHKEEAVAKLISNGTTITTTMDHELEKEAIESVCAKKKNYKICMEGRRWTGFQKKRFLDDIRSWIVSTIFKRDGSTLKSSGFTRREIEQSNENSEKMLMFMSSKFPDFESSTSAHVSGGANDLDGQLNVNDSLI